MVILFTLKTLSCATDFITLQELVEVQNVTFSHPQTLQLCWTPPTLQHQRESKEPENFNN